jgi:hypothetical protein
MRCSKSESQLISDFSAFRHVVVMLVVLTTASSAPENKESAYADVVSSDRSWTSTEIWRLSSIATA